MIARAAPTPETLLSAKIPTRFGLAVIASLTWLAAVLMSLLLKRWRAACRPQVASPALKPLSRSLIVSTPATEDSISTFPDVLPCCLASWHSRSPACWPALTLSVPMKPSAGVVTAVSAMITFLPAWRARLITLLSASEELGASTIASAPREIEFSTSWTCSLTSVSDVGPNSPTLTP